MSLMDTFNYYTHEERTVVPGFKLNHSDGFT
jgi:hypothetical protein